MNNCNDVHQKALNRIKENQKCKNILTFTCINTTINTSPKLESTNENASKNNHKI